MSEKQKVPMPYLSPEDLVILREGPTPILGDLLSALRYSDAIDVSSIPKDNRWFSRMNRMGTKIVKMDDAGEITAGPNQQKCIATRGLSVCSAVAVAIEHPDGRRRGYIQHYSPHEKIFSVAKLRQALGSLADPSSRSSVLIMTPGKVNENEPDGIFAPGPVPVDPGLAELMAQSAKQRLGDQADIRVYVYDWTYSATDGAGTLMIDFQPDGTTTILADAIPIDMLTTAPV